MRRANYLVKGISCGNEGDIKRLELIGKNGRKCIFDLRNSTKGGTGEVKIVNKKGQTLREFDELFDEPYATLINRVLLREIKNPDKNLRFDLPVEVAKSILMCIDEISSLVNLFESLEIPFRLII